MLYNWFQHISFAAPWAFMLAALLPVFILSYRRSYWRNSGFLTITTTHFLPKQNFWQQHIPFVLQCIAWLCLCIALAQPQYSNRITETKGKGIGVVLCFDISGSMLEKDFAPNRLEAAKEVAASFVQQRRGDAIGITIFSSKSFTLCPITTDHSTVLQQINNIQSGYLQDDGTAIGSGLATSVDRLRNTDYKSKVVILLTDGVDFGGQIPPDKARDMAQLFGIKVYTIGMGTLTQMNTSNANNTSGFNENLLQNIATVTGGQYFHAANK
ncbi:MAG TPA: aerotolerance regulator BatA, partial [Chitinophagaceae bacterium]|nr:aerotolerance regulator BatA [Chitinophagaceae bacterium]